MGPKLLPLGTSASSMTRLLQLGLLFGFIGVFVAAYFFPWVAYPRFATAANVVANGGRAEQFLVRLPSDLVHSADSDASDFRSGAYAASLGLAENDERAASRVEHFKLRDVNGNVLGVAARHWTMTGDQAQRAWMLNLPSRGTLVASGPGELPGSIEQALAAEGWQFGQDFAGAVSIETGQTATGSASTGEFAEIEFEIVETWNITGVNASGEIQGTIELNTIGRRQE